MGVKRYQRMVPIRAHKAGTRVALALRIQSRLPIESPAHP
jgi:hypothetical protein